MKSIRFQKVIFYIIALSSFAVMPFQACAPLNSLTEEESGTFPSISSGSGLGSFKTCEAIQNPEYRSSLLTKTEISYILSDLFASEIGANANILKKVNEMSEIKVDKLADSTIFSENNTGDLNSETYIFQLMDVAQLLFDQYALGTKINTECLNASSACLNNFLNNTLSRLWRRPALNQEKAVFTEIFNRSIALKEKLNLAYVIALSSPQFYYKNYLPRTNAEDLSYSQFALASRISFFLYNSVPDSALWQDAQNGKLSDPTVVQSHIDRILTREPFVSRFVKHTLSTWLGIADELNSNLSTTNDKGISIPLKVLAQQQYLQIYDVVMKNESLSQIFSSDTLYMNKALASYLGLNASQYTDQLQKVNAIPGSLEGSYLASAHFANATTNSTPKTLVTRRGIHIARNFMCEAIPVNEADPDAVSKVLGPAALTMTQIEIGNIRRSHVSCKGCHKEIDKMGMGAEFVDSFGRLRQSYSTGQKINVNFTITESASEAVEDLPSFLKSVSQDKRVFSCFVKSTMSKVAPLILEESNPCANDVVEANLNSGIRSYIKGLVTSKFFTQARSL